MMTPEELESKFRLSFAQYSTIDRDKTERFGTLVQGFLAIKMEDNCKIIPFSFSDIRTLDLIILFVKELKTDYLGVSFVQHYIHYS